MKFNLDLLNNIQFNHGHDSEIVAAMTKVYHDADMEMLREGKENLENYLKLALRISARLLHDGGDHVLTLLNKLPTIKERSKSNQTTNH